MDGVEAKKGKKTPEAPTLIACLARWIVVEGVIFAIL
jgi:hypothetical protein